MFACGQDYVLFSSLASSGGARHTPPFHKTFVQARAHDMLNAHLRARTRLGQRGCCGRRQSHRQRGHPAPSTNWLHCNCMPTTQHQSLPARSHTHAVPQAHRFLRIDLAGCASGGGGACLPWPLASLIAFAVCWQGGQVHAACNTGTNSKLESVAKPLLQPIEAWQAR